MKPSSQSKAFPALFSVSSKQGCRWLCVAALLLGNHLSLGANLLKWDVTGTTGTTGSSAASAPAPGVSGSAMTVVATVGNATGNSTSPSATWNRTFTVNTDFTAAQTAGNYFSFTTTAAAGYTVSISGMTGLNLSRTSSGPTAAGLFYSTDGINFTQTGSTFTVGSSLASAATAFDDTIAVTPIVISGGSTGYWRLVVSGGSATSRLGIGNGGTDDFTLTGTSVSDVVVQNLLWTGIGGSTWNTTSSNTNWANTSNANAAAAFVTGDNVTISKSSSIAVDAGGISFGNMTVNHSSGLVDLTGGAISGLSLTKSDSGILSLGGNNLFSGDLSITGGTLQTSSNTALGIATVAINGGTLKTTVGASSISNVLLLGTAGGTLDIDADVTFPSQINTSGGAINVANRLTKSGAGILTVSKTGTAAMGAQTVIGSAAGMIELNITAGGVVFSGTGQRNLGGTCIWNAPVTLSGGTLLLHGGTLQGTGTITVLASSSINSRLNFKTATVSNPITVPAAVTLSLDSSNGDNALAVSSVISGDGAVTKTGNGTVRVEGSNLYTGITTVIAGTLRIGTGTSGKLGSNNVVVNAGTLQFNRDDNVTIPNQISGAGNLLVSSNATTSLAAENSYTGITTITDGRLGALVITDGGINSSIGASGPEAAKLVFNGGSLSYEGAADTSSDREFSLGTSGGGLSASSTGGLNFTSTSPITLSGDAYSVLSRVVTVGQSASAGALTVGTIYKIVSTGTTDFTLIGAANNAVGTVFTATGAGLGTGTVEFGGLVVGTVYQIVTVGSTDYTAVGAANNLVGTLFTATGAGFGTGTATYGALVIGQTYRIRTTASDFTTLGAADNLVGTTFVATGTGIGLQASAGVVAYSHVRNFRLGGSGTGSSSLAASINDGTVEEILANGPILNAVSLSKNNSSVWLITGTNNYSGPTAVNAGTLLIDGNNTAAKGAVSVVSGAFLGGNGVCGGAVTLSSGGGLATKISDWTGAAGTGYTDLSVAKLTALGNVQVSIDATGITNFTEAPKSFTILNSGGIIGSLPTGVTVTTTNFPGTGTWSLAKAGDSVVLNYAVAVANPYADWANTNGLSGSGALASADPDRDGITNLIEFVIGGNPSSGSEGAKQPSGVVIGSNLVFTFRRSDVAAYLNPTVQYGSDLVGWTTAQSGVAGVSIAITNDIVVGIDQVVVTIPKSLGANSKLFARLNVTTTAP